MKFYVATKLENFSEAQRVIKLLTDLGHTVTYDWTVHGSVYRDGLTRVREVAHLEAKGVRDADVVIVILTGGRGTHVELGMAVAYGASVILYGTEAHFAIGPEACAFYRLDCVRHVTNDAELLAMFGIKR